MSKPMDLGVCVKAYDEALAALVRCIDELHEVGMAAATAYWDFVRREEARRPGYENRTSLELSCYRRGNHIEIKWSHIKWFGKTGSRTKVRTPLRRGTETFAYHENTLKAHAKEWEWEMVKETEQKMAIIRQSARHVVRAIISMRSAGKVDKKNLLGLNWGRGSGEAEEDEHAEIDHET